MADRHKIREITIFKAFAKVCDLPIILDSIEKRKFPHPDIQCEASGTGPIAFELVEIIDRNFANTLGKQIATQKELSEYHSNLPKEKRILFDTIYSNALISVRFPNSCTSRQRIKLFPIIFDHLLTLDEQFEGDTFEKTLECRNKFRGVSISRGRFNGPLFDSPAGGSIGDPTVSTIKSKFDKKYESKYPLHLLGYIDLNPMFSEDIWINSIKDFVKASIQKCQFEKVWIFDFRSDEIKFSYP